MLVRIKCANCGIVHTIQVEAEAFAAYVRGEGYVWDLFPDMTTTFTDMLISKVCTTCQFKNIQRMKYTEGDRISKPVIFNVIGWYRQRGVNRRSRKAWLGGHGIKYVWLYKNSWMRFNRPKGERLRTIVQLFVADN